MDLYVAAPVDPHFVRRFKEVSGEWTVSDWSPDETKVVVVESISINESYIHIIEVASGRTETITPRPNNAKAQKISASDPKWSKDGEGIYYITDEGSEFRRVVHLDRDSGKTAIVTLHMPWDVEEFDLSDDGLQMAWVSNQQGISRLDNVACQRLVPVLPETGVLPPSPPGMLPSEPSAPAAEIITGLRFRPESHVIGFSRSTARSSLDAYSLNHDKNQPSPVESLRWSTSESGGLDSRTFGDPEWIEYPSFDGRKIPAFVYRPSARRFPGPRPVLIDIHGGPEGQFRPGFLGRLNYWIDELGLVVIFPNVRGSSGYGKSYLKLDNGKLRGDTVKDIGALLDWIARQKGMDKSRVGVIGGSYGGFMSLAVQANYNDRIRCGIDIVGISNFVTFLQNTQGYRRDLRRAEYGDERDPEMRAYLEKVSPLASADKIRTPILVVQGQNDPRVPISEAEQMVAALRKNGMPVWYVIGTNEGHGFAKKANQDYLQAVEVEFLRRYLMGSEKIAVETVGERYAVSGIVTYRGQPLQEGTIEFHPAGAGGRRASGTIRDGRFTLTTVDPDDGVLPGIYKITIVSRGQGAKLPARYSNPDTTSLRCQVNASRNTFDFEIAD